MAPLPRIWIAHPDELRDCCDHIRRHDVIGFDTEFIGEATFYPQLCLIQIATAERLCVIDPFAVGPLDEFWDSLTDPSRTVVVHAAREEIRIGRHACGRIPPGLFDLQIAAGLVGIGYPLGYAALVRQVLREPLQKGETLTDWSRRPLTPQQLEYAFADVCYLLPVHARVQKRLTEFGRAEWLAEEMQALVCHALSDDPAVERWRKLRGIGNLDRKRLAVVRELFAWRESAAERQNRPVRSVLRDDLLIEIARRLPQHERDFETLRGVTTRERGAILEAVLRGRETPQDEWPKTTEREIEIPSVSLVTSLLGAVLGDLCARAALSAALVGTTSDLRALVRSRYDNKPVSADDCGLSEGWRAREILPILTAVLEGRGEVRIGNLHNDAPLDWNGEAGAMLRPLTRN